MYKMKETFVLLALSPSAINQIVLDSHVGGPPDQSLDLKLLNQSTWKRSISETPVSDTSKIPYKK